MNDEELQAQFERLTAAVIATSLAVLARLGAEISYRSAMVAAGIEEQTP